MATENRKRKKRTPIERFLALSDAGKEIEYARYERHIPLAETRPLTPAERKLWRKAKCKMGRPAVGGGAKPISVTVERGLLDRADRFAKRRHLKRSELIAQALELVLKQAG